MEENWYNPDTLILPSYNVGSRVRHSKYGKGTIKGLRRGGRALLVLFDNYGSLPIEVKALDTSLIVGEVDSDKNIILKQQSDIETKKSEVEEKEIKKVSYNPAALRTIESLRLGTVPGDDLEVYTVGRQKEIKIFNDNLENIDKGQSTVIIGQYGTGKTHLLELISNYALHKGFLVGEVTLGTTEIPPSNPKRVYQSIVHSLRYPENENLRGIEPLLNKTINNQQLLEKWGVTGSKGKHGKKHLFITTALAYYYNFIKTLEKNRHSEDYIRMDMQVLIEWLEGYPSDHIDSMLSRFKRYRFHLPRLYALMDYRPWARIYSYLLSGISLLAYQNGYKGIVVLIDEAEFYSILSAQNRDFAEYLFRSLALISIGPENVKFKQEIFNNFGGYGILKTVPPYFSFPDYFYPIIAVTPDAGGVGLLKSIFNEENIVELSELTVKDYRDLIEKIINLYRSGYPKFKIKDTIIKPLGDLIYSLVNQNIIENPRQGIKLIIELLDSAREDKEIFSTIMNEIKTQWNDNIY